MISFEANGKGTYKLGIPEIRKSRVKVRTVSTSYVPAQGDFVIGVVMRVLKEIYKLDVCSTRPAYMEALAFENGNKYTAPRLEIGDVVIAKVVEDDPRCEFEVSCAEKGLSLGVLSNGVVLNYPQTQIRRLKETNFTEWLSTQYSNYTFRIAIGTNGRLWLSSPEEILHLLIVHLKKIEYLTTNEILEYMETLDSAQKN